MAENVTAYHRRWLETEGRDGRPHKDSNFRIVSIPPSKSEIAWSVYGYKDRWDLIEEKLGGDQS